MLDLQEAIVSDEEMALVRRSGQYLTTVFPDEGPGLDVYKWQGALYFDSNAGEALAEEQYAEDEQSCCGCVACEEDYAETTAAFEEARSTKPDYRQTIGPFDFGEALIWLNNGHLLARQGWNGKDMFIYLVNGSTFEVNRAPLLGIFEEGYRIDYRPHIDMKTADGSCVPWVASQTDILADDWYLVEKD